MATPPMTRRAALAQTVGWLCLGHAWAATAPLVRARDELAEWIDAQRPLSIAFLLRNLSPTQPVVRDIAVASLDPSRVADARAAAAAGKDVHFEGERFIQHVTPAPGAVLAAPLGGPGEPDYAFHWVRDSSLIMYELAQLVADGAADARRQVGEYVQFSRRLQELDAVVGFGEARYNLDASEDFIQWSRPQYDGPALRVLTMLLIERRVKGLSAATRATLAALVKHDLDNIAAHWELAGFDLWEEYKAHDFHARVVQISALEQGADWAEAHGMHAADYRAAAQALRRVTLSHWQPGRGYYGFHDTPTIYWNGQARLKPGDNLDTAVVETAVHARLAAGPYSLLDERVMATAVHVEDLFERLYPVNQRRARDEGVLYGRYDGDEYYGGNPWVFITFEIAQAHYRTAALLGAQRSLPVTTLNAEFLGRAFARVNAPLGQPGEDVLADRGRREALQHGLLVRGDDILRALRRYLPASGALPEQLDRRSGAVTSSANISWSHAAFLGAVRARTEASASLSHL